MPSMRDAANGLGFAVLDDERGCQKSLESLLSLLLVARGVECRIGNSRQEAVCIGELRHDIWIDWLLSWYWFYFLSKLWIRFFLFCFGLVCMCARTS